MAFNGPSLFNTPLQMLLEEINFQRQKEMRLVKDDSGFVVLQGTTWWTDLFVRHFLFQSERDARDCDDLLFFVRKKHIRGTSRNAPKYETEIEVFRKDSKKLPIGDPDVDWEETVYLNLIIHQFDYTLTLAICTRTSPKELQVLRRHSQKVYASPSRRKMDTKGDSEEITYPHICFMVDNFDEVFHDILVRDGEMVCVELVAKDRDGSVQGVIFLGSIRYDALKKVYDARQSSLSSKVAQRMSFGFFNSGGPQTRCEFVRMKGPQGKGHAEMAVTKPKGSGVETPTSEPGFCATDMWDSEWEEDVDDYNYRHQRRLSDPSANLTYFSNKYAWRAKGTNDMGGFGSKARSEQEGLDCMASEVSEIESGDVRDDRPASLVVVVKNVDPATTPPNNEKENDDKVTPPNTGNCCECFPSPKKKWLMESPSSAQMSDVYSIDGDKADFSSPACLATMSKGSGFKHRHLLAIESEIEFKGSKVAKKQKSPKKTPKKKTVNGNERYDEVADDAMAGAEIPAVKIDTKTKMIRVNGKEEFPGEIRRSNSLFKRSSVVNSRSSDCISVNHRVGRPKSHSIAEVHRAPPAVVSPKVTPRRGFQRFFSSSKSPAKPLPVPATEETSFIVSHCEFRDALESLQNDIGDDVNGNRKVNFDRNYFTLPKMRKSRFHPSILYSREPNRTPFKVPKRTTVDGTNIYYWCDVPKSKIKELDDGAYNPLWTSRGFTQTFHFWKENRRQQSTPLNAFLTYVTLPWWSIAKDLLDHRETPILTF